MSLPSVAVIGDIHGRLDLLEPLLARIHRPILVAGDLCDRGPDTRGCLDRLIQREVGGVLGNHDLWFARWATGGGFDTFALAPRMGGAATLSSYDAGPADWEHVPRAHAHYVNGLHLVVDLEVDGECFWLAHAGIPSHRAFDGVEEWCDVVPWLARNHPTDLLWPPNEPEHMLAVDRPIIMGHRPRREPLDLGHVIAIDTGAGAGFSCLTALLLPERRFISVRG